MARLLAAMSGGVDSSVAAALCVEAGHDVTGVTLKQWEFPDEAARLEKGCCTLDAVDDARRAADLLGIPHYTLDFREVFSREVVDPFVREYAAGRTPNPCVRCNRLVRFGALLDKAERLGFDGIVTGHYARIVRDRDGTFRLRRPRERTKDQTYVLHAVGQDALRRARFPLGEMPSKDDVRALARDLGLRNWDREDSVDVCFVGEDRLPGDVVADRAPGAVRPGPILDRSGEVVGEHRGLAHYTVGQRRGLGPVRTAPSRPSYVTALDAERNAVVVDDPDALEAFGLEASEPRWVARPPDDGDLVDVQIRYRSPAVPATFRTAPDGFRLDFHEPVRAVAPGQAAVLYAGDEVLGGGTITRAC